MLCKKERKKKKIDEPIEFHTFSELILHSNVNNIIYRILLVKHHSHPVLVDYIPTNKSFT